MGCDIHGLCEVKENGTWRLNTDPVFPNPYYVSDKELIERRKSTPDYERCEWQMEEFDTHPDTGRNYDWFAILADVRNGRGFAGVSTGDGFAIIDEPRGVPDDATEEWQEQVDQWGIDMHSQSYLSVQDFDDFDWTQTTNKSGVITLEEFKGLKRWETPESWSGWISGPGIVVVSMEDAKKILKGESVVISERNPFGQRDEAESKIISLTSGHNIHVNYVWEVEYWDWFSHKFKTVINPLKELAKKYEDVRYVFGFDN